MDTKANFLYITHVEKEGPFLKVWGQVDKSTAINVEQALLKTTPHFDNGYSFLSVENLQNGVLCCAKYKDNKYYRARIVCTEQVPSGLVEVNFLDFGNRDVVPCHNLRSMQNFTSSFISLPPLANCFLLAEAVSASGEWIDVCFQEILKEIRYTEVNYIIVAQAVKHSYVRLLMHGQDLAHNFINRGLMSRTSLHTQEAVLLTMLNRKSSPPITAVTTPLTVPTAQQPQTLLTYKAFTLEAGTQHPVYVSYISDGPCHFSVQLKQTEEVLVKLMNDINSMPLKPLEDCPLPGTVCVARCIEDGHICRAVVTNEVDSQFKVFYVDFGNSEVVPLEALYQIPFKYVIPKVMAIRFALAGIEKSTVTIEMKCAFKQFVDNRLLYMKVIPVATRTALPRCELLDPMTKTSALEVLHRAAQNAYPEPLTLNRGFSQSVRVSYVFSCNRFYVQLKSKENELAQLMIDLQESCLENEPMSPDQVKDGLPCCALYEGDGQWYRSQVVEVCQDNTVKVRYIDYGNEELVPVVQLKLVEGEQLTVLRPQAIECCLNGYQNMGEDIERDNFLEEIILEKEFTMKVVEMQNGRALVDLIDSSNYNVASLLLEKIANARSQVSPMLVQAGNRIEHRKSVTSPIQNFKDRKGGRDSNKNWNEKTNDSISWRQENKDRESNKGFRNREPNDQSNEGSWRQNKNDNNFRNDDRGNQDGNKNFSISERLKVGDQSYKSKNFKNQNNEWEDNKSANNDYVPESSVGDSWNDHSQQNNEKKEDSWNNKSDRPSFNKNRNSQWGDKSSDQSGGGSFKGRSERNTSDNWDNKGRGDKWESKSNDKWGREEKTDSWNKDAKSHKDEWQEQKGDSWGSKGKFGNDDNSNSRSGQGRYGDRGGRDKGGDWKGKSDKWGDRDSRDSDRKNDWGKGTDREGDRPFRKFNDDKFGHRENKFDKQENTWDAESPKTGGQGFKKNFRRENSNVSSSSSESFRKGQGSGAYESKKRFDRPPRSSSSLGKSTGGGDSWDVSAAADTFDVVPSTAQYKSIDISLDTESTVTISWFHNPDHFYIQLSEYENQLKTMMENIQQSYKSRKPSAAQVNSLVISIFPEDKVLYRAKVIEASGSTYKVFYIDFGNVATVDKVWPLETKYHQLPAQAICCGLNGVEPANEDWGEASVYSQYFDKESFNCKFISNDNGRYLVEMGFGDCRIVDLLARDFLIKNDDKPKQEVSFELLKCQQFRATLLSINNLSDILIQTARNELFKCSVFNLEKAVSTFVQNLQNMLNQVVIVDVHDVSDDGLIVTFYENEDGQKIELVDPDPVTYPHFNTLLDNPVFSETIYGWVSHIDGERIYVQPNERLEDLKVFEDNLSAYYDTLPDELQPVIPAQDFMYAVKTDDFLWHRVLALQDATENDDEITVQFVDTGKIELVLCKNLKSLIPEFFRAEKFCFPVTIRGLKDPLGEVEIEAKNIILKQIQPKRTRTDEVFEALSMEGRGEPLMATPSLEATIPENHVYVNVSHVDSPNEFYIQKFQDIDGLNELQAQLQEEVESLPILETPTAGVLCAAPYSIDEQWYRAEVLDADADITTVRFVDYGNTDVLNNETVKVRTLSPEMLSLAVHATKSSLKVAPVDQEWSPKAIEVLNELVFVENVTVKFIDQDEKTNYVELYKDGHSIKQALLDSYLAVDCADSVEEGNTGFVSHVNSPSEFFIQLECYSSELERFSEQLSERDAENFPELEDLSPGSLCAAMYLDEQWYRARILSNTVAGIEVLYIDFGNSSISSSLRQLPEDLIMPQPLAQKCSLQIPDGLLYWSPQAVEKFLEIAADGQTIFTVERLSTGETSTVRLLLDGEDIINHLVPQTVDGHLSNIESLDSFDTVVNEEVTGKYQLETPPGLVWSEESFKKFIEIDNKGQTIYQIEYVSEDTIRLYINGKDIRAELGGVKQTSFASDTSKAELNYTDVTANEEYSNYCVDELIDNVALSDNVEQSQDNELNSSNPVTSDSNTSAKDTDGNQDDISKHEQVGEESMTEEDKLETPNDGNDVNISHSSDKDSFKDNDDLKFEKTNDESQTCDSGVSTAIPDSETCGLKLPETDAITKTDTLDPEAKEVEHLTTSTPTKSTSTTPGNIGDNESFQVAEVTNDMAEEGVTSNTVSETRYYPSDNVDLNKSFQEEQVSDDAVEDGERFMSVMSPKSEAENSSCENANESVVSIENDQGFTSILSSNDDNLNQSTGDKVETSDLSNASLKSTNDGSEDSQKKEQSENDADVSRDSKSSKTKEPDLKTEKPETDASMSVREECDDDQPSLEQSSELKSETDLNVFVKDDLKATDPSVREKDVLKGDGDYSFSANVGSKENILSKESGDDLENNEEANSEVESPLNNADGGAIECSENSLVENNEEANSEVESLLKNADGGAIECSENSPIENNEEANSEVEALLKNADGGAIERSEKSPVENKEEANSEVESLLKNADGGAIECSEKSPVENREEANSEVESLLKNADGGAIKCIEKSPVKQVSPIRQPSPSKFRNLDEKIVPAALSRPQTPLSDSDEKDSNVQSN